MTHAELQEQIKDAMKARDKVRLAILRQVHGELKDIEINERRETTEEDVSNMIKRVIKQTSETLEASIKAANNQERTDTLTRQVEILARYGQGHGRPHQSHRRQSRQGRSGPCGKRASAVGVFQDFSLLTGPVLFGGAGPFACACRFEHMSRSHWEGVNRRGPCDNVAQGPRCLSYADCGGSSKCRMFTSSFPWALSL